MKIIKLGDFNFRFICPDCRTEFEIETKELLKENDIYYVRCPLCYKQMIMRDEYDAVKYAKRRKELSKNE